MTALNLANAVTHINMDESHRQKKPDTKEYIILFLFTEIQVDLHEITYSVVDFQVVAVMGYY